MKISDHILMETADWIAINKPAGLLSIPDREGKEISLKIILREKFGNIFTVHRLDRDTSGVIIFAKNESAHQSLTKQFEERETKKIYNGLVLGSVGQQEGVLDSPIMEHPAQNGSMIVHRRGKQARTDFRVLHDFGIYSWMEFQIHTGRTHQIRVHMKDFGHPIACDNMYGDGQPILVSSFKNRYKLSKTEEEERPILSRLALHSARLTFRSNGDEMITINAPLPKDLRATLQQLEKRKK